MEHKKDNVEINGEIVQIDIELIDIIKLLNKNGWITSGCCVGDYVSFTSPTWIVIQETDDKKIVRLMQNIKGNFYSIRKRMYYLNSKDILYSDYVLEICDDFSSYEDRLICIEDICKRLSKVRALKEYVTDKIMEM